MMSSRTARTVGRTLAQVALVGTAAGAGALLWGSRERLHPRVRHYDLSLPHQRELPDLTLLHISDLHLYPGQEFIIDFLDKVAKEHAIDFVLSTGDNFGSRDALPLLQRAYAPLQRYPGAFVFGSNDYFSPRSKSWGRYLRRDPRRADAHKPARTPDLPTEELRDELRNFGWVDLNNASVALTLPQAKLALTGVDDPHINRDHPVPLPSTWGEVGVLSLGVTHAPYRRVVDGWTVAGADLILAGHTHGGQFGLPGVTSLVTNCDLPTSHGRGLHPWTVNDLTDYVGDTIPEPVTSWLHVTAGLGTSPFVPFRIATPPEVSLIHISSTQR